MEERDLIQAEFEAGSAGIRDLLDAEQRLRNVDQALINALFDLLIADLRLRLHVDQLPALTPPPGASAPSELP